MKNKQVNLDNEIGQDYKLNLTDEEWVRLIDGECDDSALPKCCANISELRDIIISIVREGRNQPIYNYKLKELMKHLYWVFDGHEFTDLPVLRKICEQIGFNPKTAKHESGSKYDR